MSMGEMMFFICWISLFLLFSIVGATRPPCPPPGYNFSLNKNLTQWQFQVNLPSLNTSSLFHSGIAHISSQLQHYQQLHDRHFIYTAERTTGLVVGNKSYWHIPKNVTLCHAKETLIKAVRFPTMMEESHLTLKLRDQPLDESPVWMPPKKDASLFASRFDNEVHCGYHPASRSIERIQWLSPNNLSLSTLGDFAKYFDGETLLSYLNVSGNVPLTLEPHGPYVTYFAKFYGFFLVKVPESIPDLAVPWSAQLTTVFKDGEGKSELDLKVNRNQAGQGTVGALEEAAMLYRYLREVNPL